MLLMLLAGVLRLGGEGGVDAPGLMSGIGGGVGTGGWYGEVQCTMGNGHMKTPMNKQTDTSENITSPRQVVSGKNILTH